MFRHYQSMFAPVSEYIESYAEVQAMTTHPLLQNQWSNTLEEHTRQLQKEAELSNHDMEKIKKIQSLFTCGIQLFLEKAGHISWQKKSVEEKETLVQALLQRPQIPQRTQEWYAQAQTLLTASEFSKLFGTEREYANLVLSKAFPQPIANLNPKFATPTQEMNAFDWGIRFEPLVKQVFSENWSLQIIDSGRVVHPQDGKVAASPDGILIQCKKEPRRTARLLEIKCPISRIMNDTIPFEYWCQMQIQMEVTNIDECEYLEVKIESPTSRSSQYTKPEQSLFDGQIWLMNKDMEYRYAYTLDEKAKYETENWCVFETIPWAITRYFHKVIQRDRSWFQNTEGIRKQFWRDVESARQGTFTLPKPTVPRGKACLIQDSPPSQTPPDAASITSA